MHRQINFLILNLKYHLTFIIHNFKMKKLSIFICCLLFQTILLCQFNKEHSYNSSVVSRHLLQDGQEYFMHVDAAKEFINITDSKHFPVQSVPVPDTCGTHFSAVDLRNDYVGHEFGIICSCQDSTSDFSKFIMNSEGEKIKDLPVYYSIDDRYLIESHYQPFESKVYSTQTLSLNKSVPNIRISRNISPPDEDPIYIGHNSQDSIFIFDEELNIVFKLEHANTTGTEWHGVSTQYILENNIPYFYFIISTYDSATGQPIETLIDQDGNVINQVINEFSNFHKYENKLNVVLISSLGIISVIPLPYMNETIELITEQTEGSLSFSSTGRYILRRYNRTTSEFSAYDSNLDLAFLEFIDDPNVSRGPNSFEDHLGNEYLIYFQQIGSQYNTVILKDFEHFQTFENSNNLYPSNLPGLETKIISFYPREENLTDIFSLQISDINEVPLNQTILFPNPSKDFITIDFLSGKMDFESISIFDTQSRLVKECAINHNENRVGIGDLSDGLYHVRLNSKTGASEVIKFIKVNN